MVGGGGGVMISLAFHLVKQNAGFPQSGKIRAKIK